MVELDVFRAMKLRENKISEREKSREKRIGNIIGSEWACLRIRENGTYNLVEKDPEGICPTLFPK